MIKNYPIFHKAKRGKKEKKKEDHNQTRQINSNQGTWRITSPFQTKKKNIKWNILHTVNLKLYYIIINLNTKFFYLICEFEGK